MRIQSVVSVLIAAVTFAARGEINVSGDTTGATDTVAIQSALDAAKTGGGTVTLGSGTFYINTQLTVDGAVTLQGQGWDKTIVKQVAAPGSDTRVVTVTGGATVRNVTLTGGHVSTTGKYTGGAGAMVKDGTLSWCCISNNTVECYSYGIGGGVSIWNSKGTVDHCIVADNTLKVTANASNKCHGGGIGIYLPTGACSVDACLIRGNEAYITSDGAGFGGGVAVDYSGMSGAVNVRNTTFVGNKVGVAGKSGKTWGAGVYADDDKAKKFTLLNCIFSGNTAANADTTGDINASSNEAFSYTIYQGNICYGTVDYNCFEKSTDVVGTHSVSGAAKFTNAAGGDYTLASDSPAKATGTTYSGLGNDLSGAAFSSAAPSMGCYEFGSTPTIVPGGEGEGEGQGEEQGQGEGQGEEDPPVVDPSDAIAVSGDMTGATDTAALNAAIAAAGANGSVALGNGTFYLNATISLSNGVKLKGQGMGKTVIRPGKAPTMLSAAPGSVRMLAAGSGDFNCLTLTDGAKLEAVTVTGGRADYGAGVKVLDGTISWCCISNNVGTGSTVHGGGVSFTGGKGRIDHSVIADNSLTGASFGAGIGMKEPSGSVEIDTCLIVGNSCPSASGGGVMAESLGSGKTLTVRNCTVTGNSSKWNGGGAHFKNGSGTYVVVNSIFVGNTGNASNPDVTREGSPSTTGSGYCYFGTQSETFGTGSAYGSVPFVGNGDYHLSAAKELGYTDATGNCVDLDNLARSGSLDVGCYEFGGSTPPPAGHTHVWSVTGYSWAADYSTCTASATCTGDASHKTNVTVTATYKVTKEPTTETMGTGTYTATFTAPFATQTKNVTLDKLPKEEPPHVDPTDAVTPSGDTTGVQDTKAIQDLIDAAAPTHGSVVLGSGVFLLDRQLMITNGVTLVGQGWTATVLKPASGKSIRLAKLDGGAKLEKVTLTGGKASDGAGVAVTDGTISWCCISNNVGTSGYGGGVSFFQGRGQIDHSIVSRNSQSGTAFGAGIGMKSQTGTVTIDTCLIYGNACTAGSGGGVMAESIGSGKAVMILNSTVTGNTTRWNAGGVHVKNGDNGTCVMINDILSGNTAGSNTPDDPDLTLENAFATGSAYDLFGTQHEAVGAGSVVGSAPFVGDGDYRLSEAKELGYEVDDPACVDLDNNGRSGFVDVGCYEFGGSAYVELPGATLYVD